MTQYEELLEFVTELGEPVIGVVVNKKNDDTLGYDNCPICCETAAFSTLEEARQYIPDGDVERHPEFVPIFVYTSNYIIYRHEYDSFSYELYCIPRNPGTLRTPSWQGADLYGLQWRKKHMDEKHQQSPQGNGRN